MGKYIVAAVLLVLYATLAVWRVREEGSAYREILRRGRGEPSMVAVGKNAAGEVGQTPPVAFPGPVPPDTPALESKPTAPAPEAVPAPLPAPAPPESIPKPDSYWLTPRMKEVWDPARLGPEQEKRLGAALHDIVLEREKQRVDGPYFRRAMHALEPLLLDAGVRKDLRYTITILDSEYPNAFSHPGGYIYLSKGLFDFIGDEDEDFVLQFVIAHEIAHVEMGHAIKCLQDPGLSKSGIGTLRQFFRYIFPYGYLEGMDFEADRWAYDRLTRQLQLTPHQALAFLQRLKGYAQRNGFENGRQHLRPMTDASPLDNHLRAHPAPFQRLDKLRKPPAKTGP